VIYKAVMKNIVAWVMTARQAAALAKLIRIQAAAYAESEDGAQRPPEIFTAEDLEAVVSLLPFPGEEKPLMVEG
jgi:hypothetical protein